MKRTVFAIALGAAASLLAAGCDRPVTQTEYNNSGATATATQAGPSTDAAMAKDAGAASERPASASAGASGAVSETVTTGKIKAAIAADAGMKDTDVSVETDNGVVRLSGTVKSQDQVAIATNLAQRQEGVMRVENNLAVK